MNNIYIPTKNETDWQVFLADPEKQWKEGYSAKELAKSWESSKGFPKEIQSILSTSTIFEKSELILGIPEFKVPLPGGSRPSQNDLFCLAKNPEGSMLSITVEGKVREDFGEILSKWKKQDNNEFTQSGKEKRLIFLKKKIGLQNTDFPEEIRYQLLHRTASAVILAEQFNAKYAIMLVHSFNSDPSTDHFDDFVRFVNLYNGTNTVKKGSLLKLTQVGEIELWTGWAQGK